MGEKENKIRTARKREILTQIELAEMAGISVNSLRLYEAGKRKPSLQVLKKIATALSVPIFDLLDNESQHLFVAGYDLGQYDSATGNSNVAQILGYTFTNDEIELINNYHALNDLGKVKAREQVEDLTEITRYQKAPLQDEAQSGEASKEGEGS